VWTQVDAALVSVRRGGAAGPERDNEGDGQMSDNNDDVGAFLAGFVVGALVGAAAALILAPQSGEVTRADLADRSRDWRSSGGDRLAQVGSALADVRARSGNGDGHGEPLPRILLNRAKDRAPESADEDATLDTNSDAEEDAPEST
jgi:hypothetical protein